MAGMELGSQAGLFTRDDSRPLPDVGKGEQQNPARVCRLDLGSLKTELEEIAGSPVSLKFDKTLNVGVSCRQDDKGFRILLNPRAFRGKRGTEDHLNSMRKMVGVLA